MIAEGKQTVTLILFLCEPACGVGFNLKQAFSELINRHAHLLPSHARSPRRTIILERRRKEHMEMSPNNVERAGGTCFPREGFDGAQTETCTRQQVPKVS